MFGLFKKKKISLEDQINTLNELTTADSSTVVFLCILIGVVCG
jgi:hypothetical protein